MATNYLIGRGELLTEPIGPPKRDFPKAAVYDFQEAKDRLLPRIEALVDSLAQASEGSTPENVVVAKFTLHPSYLAKSFFPDRFLRAASLDALGTRYAEIIPERRIQNGAGPMAASDIFIAATRSTFENLAQTIESLHEGSREAEEFAYFEGIATYEAAEKIRVSSQDDQRVELEIGIHIPSSSLVQHPRRLFIAYARGLGYELAPDLSFDARGLWFVPAIGARRGLDELARFSLLRVVRDMPRLRELPARPPTRRVAQQVTLPSGGAIAPNLRVAILDGGTTGSSPLDPWINSRIDMNPAASDLDDYLSHGTGVTSAFLFGAIVPGGAIPRPFAEVDHYRVLDDSTSSQETFELYRTLGHIEEVLLTRSYEFVNLSLGPELPIEDNEVHAWTAVIDELLSDGLTLMTVAVGNNGGLDWESGNARVQVPSDSVNALAVGASTGTDINWGRAFYSAVGPGRLPGLVKPDILAHGGDQSDYFHVLAPGPTASLDPQMGTSFAAPLALRSAVAVRSVMGDGISVLAIKALLINSARRTSLHDQREVGWGKIPDDIASLITCRDGTARIVYQGELRPGKYIRAAVPMPMDPLSGFVTLGATFCFSSSVDPQAPDAYTRAGLQVVFRPDVKKVKDGKVSAETRTFFSPSDYATESNLRSDSGKWETVLNSRARMLGSKLADPAFDIHYVARSESSATSIKDAMRYALVIDIEAPKHLDLFESILSAYPGLLTRLEPQVSVPLNV